MSASRVSARSSRTQSPGREEHGLAVGSGGRIGSVGPFGRRSRLRGARKGERGWSGGAPADRPYAVNKGGAMNARSVIPALAGTEGRSPGARASPWALVVLASLAHLLVPGAAGAHALPWIRQFGSAYYDAARGVATQKESHMRNAGNESRCGLGRVSGGRRRGGGLASVSGRVALGRTEGKGVESCLLPVRRHPMGLRRAFAPLFEARVRNGEVIASKTARQWSIEMWKGES